MKNPLSFSLLLLCICKLPYAQSIGTFTSVTPTAQTQNLVLPVTHTFQRIIKSGDALSAGGSLGNNTDFTGYVPISGSSTRGYLSISNETTPAGCAVLGISYNGASHTWGVDSGGNVNFLTNAVFGTTSRFCSGTVTPNNTIIVCEEDITAGDANADGYQDRGWLIEIDPATRTVINQDGLGVPDRLWAIGRAPHENAAIKSDNTVLYTGVDNGTNGYLYKFIPSVPGNFSNGTLYVLQTTAALGTGTWRVVANTSQANRNSTLTLSAAAGAYNFNGIEDVEIGPGGIIYFAAKAQGKIYRFTDNGSFGTATDISGLEVFAGNHAYPAITSYDVDGGGPLPAEPWGLGNDNLAFDGEGNLWVCQDAIAGSDRNHIWVVGPGHTQAVPQVRIFATTPVRCEPTGITFSPDYKFMFISFMNPNTTNTAAQTDAAGVPVIFNTHTTAVIGRKEVLGPFVLAATFNRFTVSSAGRDVIVNWEVRDVLNHSYFDIERSADGRNFEKIYTENTALPNGSSRSFSYTDRHTFLTELIYYRLKQVDNNGNFHYSSVQSIRRSPQNNPVFLYPVPAADLLRADYTAAQTGYITLQLLSASGHVVLSEKRMLSKGKNTISLSVKKLGKGSYTLIIKENDVQLSRKFTKL
ncbi:MAG: alkaline phosphatase PhoX [Ferruginibacter sp.]